MSRPRLGKLLRRLVAPAAVLAAILVLFFRHITPADILANFLRIPPAYLAAFVALILLGTAVRTWLYRELLSRRLGFAELFPITLVRNFSVDLLPGRTASIAFFSWLTRKKGIALEESASSFVISVFYESAALALMLGLLLPFFSAGLERWPFAAAMAGLLALSGLVLFGSRPLLAFVERSGWLRRRPLDRLAGPVRQVGDYLAAHEGAGERLKLLAISFASRLCKYLYNYILFEGVLHLGFSLKNFALFCVGLAATEASALLPVHGPAGFGTWELAFALVFSALRVPAANIQEAGFVIHITSQAWEYGVGLLALAGLTLGRRRNGSGLRAPGVPPATGRDPSRSR